MCICVYIWQDKINEEPIMLVEVVSLCDVCRLVGLHDAYVSLPYFIFLELNPYITHRRKRFECEIFSI